MADTEQACKNTDREIWRGPDEGGGDYYADSLHITKENGLGINCGGMVYVRPIREWHALLAENKMMREALGKVMPHLVNDSPGGCTGEYPDCDHCEAIRLARSALAKTTGAG